VIAVKTEQGLDEFQVRLLRDDGVGLLTDREGESYLILDSLDYWYDLIQEHYPAKIKCACKNDWFKVSFSYEYREGSPDIRNVLVSTVCTRCGRASDRLLVDIDYGSTDVLLDKPITFCEKPLIKYKYSQFTGIWMPDDLNQVLRFLIEDQGLTAHYHYFKSPEKLRVFEPLTLDQALNRGGDFLAVYLSSNNPVNAVASEDEMGVMVDTSIWRRQEIIYLFRVNMNGLPLHYVQFCTQYIDQGAVIDKSIEFKKMTDRFKVWLSQTFVTSRGRNCFDGQQGYQAFLSSSRGS